MSWNCRYFFMILKKPTYCYYTRYLITVFKVISTLFSGFEFSRALLVQSSDMVSGQNQNPFLCEIVKTIPHCNFNDIRHVHHNSKKNFLFRISRSFKKGASDNTINYFDQSFQFSGLWLILARDQIILFF